MKKSLIPVLIVIVCASSLHAAVSKQYFAIFTDGKKIGYAIHTRSDNGQKVTTTEKVSMSITRAGSALTVTQSETSIETPDGKPLGFETISQIGGMKQTVKGTVTPDGTIQYKMFMGAGAPQQATMPWPEGALMSEGVSLLQKKTGITPGTRFTTKVFSPSTLSAMDANVLVMETEKVDMLGRVSKLAKVEVEMAVAGSAMKVINYIDADLKPQKTVTQIMGMTIEMIACNKEFALSKNDIVDFIDKSMIQCPAAIDASAKTIKYTLQPLTKSVLTFPQTDSQSTVAEANYIILTATTVAAKTGQKIPYSGTDANAIAALKPSRYVQSDNKEIISLAKQALDGATDAAQAAANIEAFVGKYIDEKNFSVGYASAVEVADSHEGDCTEHAVLAAALCKAAGIPARVVSGVVYVDAFNGRKDVFVGHAWFSCFINGTWVDYDATKHKHGPNAITMSIGDGDPEQFFGMLSTMGNFKIADVKAAN